MPAVKLHQGLVAAFISVVDDADRLRSDRTSVGDTFYGVFAGPGDVDIGGINTTALTLACAKRNAFRQRMLLTCASTSLKAKSAEGALEANETVLLTAGDHRDLGKTVDALGRAAEQLGLFVGRVAGGQAFERVPQDGLARTDAVRREVALEDAAIGAKNDSMHVSI